jgi:hypothetical protein
MTDHDPNPPHEDADDAFAESVVYRSAYGLASRLAEAKRFGLSPGRHQRSRAGGGDAAAILADVARQLGHDPEAPPPAVRDGVDDALAGRRPRW